MKSESNNLNKSYVNLHENMKDNSYFFVKIDIFESNFQWKVKTCVVICCNAWFHFGCVQMSNKILKEIGEEIGIVHCVKNKIRNYQ